MALASCQNDNAAGDDQASIDSMVNVRVEEMRLEMMMQNDSIINSLAAIRADSIIAAMKGGNTVTTTTKRTTTVKSAPSGGSKATAVETTPNREPANTGKNTGEQGDNTGKRTGEEGTNTGKRR